MIQTNFKHAGLPLLSISATPAEFSGVNTADANISNGWWRQRSSRWRRDAAAVLFQTRVLMLLLTHTGAPLRARAIAGCAALYLVSPIQLIPTFIPVIGQLDDLFVLFVGMKLARKLTPPAILAQCEEHAKCGKFFSTRSEKPHCAPENTVLPLQHDP